MIREKPHRAGIHSVAVMCLVIGFAAAGSPKADPVVGATIYQRCLACHALSYHRTGPMHCGLLGRKAGSASGYRYSEAMRASGIIWTRQTLDAFLASPTTYVPGTLMGYAGITDAQERTDLIAYLASVSEDDTKCPQVQGERK